MTDLQHMKCVACRRGEPRLTDDEIAELLPKVAGWDVKEAGGVNSLERTYKFKDFAEAIAFTNRVSQIAEQEDHHPKLITEYGKVTVVWWTHIIRGLHNNDFIMAAKTDTLIDAI